MVGLSLSGTVTCAVLLAPERFCSASMARTVYSYGVSTLTFVSA